MLRLVYTLSSLAHGEDPPISKGSGQNGVAEGISAMLGGLHSGHGVTSALVAKLEGHPMESWIN